MKYWGLAAFAAASAWAAEAAEAAPEGASDVVKLTADTFQDFIKTNELTIAEFFAPWCGHCKQLAPEYEKAATSLKDKNITIAQIDCTKEEKLCADQKVQGYPTIKVFRNKGEVEGSYSGSRDAEGIVSYMIRMSMPPVSPLDASSIEKFVTENPFSIIGFFKDKEHNETFTELANALREKFTFAATSDVALAKNLNVSSDFSAPSLVVVKRSFAEEVAVISDASKWKVANLTTFIKGESIPLVGDIGPENYSDYVGTKLPMGIFFSDNLKEKEEFDVVLRELATKYKSQIVIGHLNASEFGAFADQVNLKEEWPAFAIQDVAASKKYPFPQDEELDDESLADFVKAVLAGEVEPSVKSEEIPTGLDGFVTKVVGKNFEKEVIDNEKDVLLEIYAPWCGHCKALAPTYNDLAQIFVKSDKLKDKVVIAKVDHTANDIPSEVAGYPTILLYPAAKKTEPVSYSGGRDLESLLEFIKTKGTHQADGKVDGAKLPEKADKKAKKAKKEEAEEYKKKAREVKDEL